MTDPILPQDPTLLAQNPIQSPTYDHCDDTWRRSITRYLHGLNFTLDLSSFEGVKSHDKIDFDFFGKDATIA